MKNILITIAFLFAIVGNSQNKGTNNIVGKNHALNSNILKETKNIQVFLPEGYANSKKKYPVIYLLDGQRFFLYGASLIQTYGEFDLTPQFILVGIINSQATRMRTFSARAKDFANYLEKEVINFIDTNYRTSKKRLLFGWAYGGGFGIETFMSKPNLFDGYILSSPFPVSSKMKRFKSFVKSNKELNTFVYFASDSKEFGVKEGTEELSSFLKMDTTKLRWKFKVLSGEKHRSTVYPALFHGLQEYFNYYREISFRDFKEFTKKGGIPYVRSYYAKRAELYNLPNKMSPFSRYNIIRKAIRANEFKSFEKLVSEFGAHNLIAELRPSWACNIADFYAKNNKKQKAIKLYQFIAKTFPTSNSAKKGLNELLKK